MRALRFRETSGWRRLRGRAAVVALVLPALSASCAKAPPSAGLSYPDALRLRGVTEVAFVPDPSAPELRLPPDEEIVRPVPGEITPPDYPEDALEARCGDAVIGLRIVVGEEGRVEEVKTSPVLESTGGSCGKRLREESVRAVSAWTFQPALWRRMVPGEDVDGDGTVDYRKVVASESIPVYLDVRIQFEVIGGEGRVKVGI